MSDAHDTPRGCSRRDLLTRGATGFGLFALQALLAGPAFGRAPTQTGGPRPGHHRARARSVIFLYMDGGPSQVDTFDPKPLLQRHHGEDPRQVIGRLDDTQFDDVGTILASPWEFRRSGESGLWISDLFPHLRSVADELCVLNGMVARFPEHTAANYFLHSGHGLQGRPSMGAWFGYGLGSDNENLPGFVVLNGGLVPPGGLDCFGPGFLPATHQGSVFRPEGLAVTNIEPREMRDGDQRRLLDVLGRLESGDGVDPAVDAAIANYETAARMQTAVPDLTDLGDESAATRALYGVDSENAGTRIYGRQCLLARRLVERGVRFIELTCPHVGHDRWDQHSNLTKGHEDNARAVDQPIAALLLDLRQRGLLDETLVVWGGEFGRTPFAQGAHGRDHNPQGYTMWLAGAGVRGGTVYGRTDDFGYRAIEGRTEVHDLHATMLHLCGLDHERLTYRFGGRDIRLTDVFGRVLHEVLA